MKDLEEVIRERAYHLWIVDGRQDGNADGHWLAAQREVLESSLAHVAANGSKKIASKAKKTVAPRRKKNQAA